ncbi:MAG: hypothetical protein N4A35_05575 [Flavobacteriales bacterium]|jgi:hypothetical protein|nr:hypothetical protein [Flavobacteriales bacterium]
MNRLKLLKISVVVLVLINLILVVIVFIGGKHHPPRHHQEKQIIIERLGFNNDQVDLFEYSIEQHIQAIRAQEKELKRLKKELYLTLKSDDTAREKELLEELMLVKKEIEGLHLKHFKEIKNLCTAEQLPKFDELAEDLAHIFAPHPPRPKR